MRSPTPDAADSAGIEQAVIYGHAGSGHPHQNFIAATQRAAIVKVIERRSDAFCRSVGRSADTDRKLKRQLLRCRRPAQLESCAP